VYKGYGGDCRNCSHNFQPLGGSDGGIGTNAEGNHTHTFNVTSGSSGDGQPHENMPPYYVLTYIMKL
jgi:microcystin-dependent protein